MVNTVIMFGLVGTVALAVVAAVGAVVGTYLFLRNNKNKKAAIDAAVNQVSKKL